MTRDDDKRVSCNSGIGDHWRRALLTFISTESGCHSRGGPNPVAGHGWPLTQTKPNVTKSNQMESNIRNQTNNQPEGQQVKSEGRPIGEMWKEVGVRVRSLFGLLRI